MAPARVPLTFDGGRTIADHETSKASLKSGHSTAQEALDKAKALHNQAVKSLPGGNTRSLLHTAPFPVFLKKGDGYQVVSEDGHT
jgi:glutamate-1-semialdehyde 2,1-aminomutase